MASVSQRRARSVAREEIDPEDLPLKQSRRKKSRWLRRLVIGGVLMIVLVLLAPVIIANTPLRNVPLRIALDGIAGTIEAGEASLNWFGGISYRNVELRDARGELLLAVAEVSSERSLLGIVTNLNDLGTFTINQPQVNLALRSDGSNAEDVLGPWLAKSDPNQPPSPSPRVTVEIVDGQIVLDDVAAQQRWPIEKLQARVSLTPESSLPSEVQLAGDVPLRDRVATFLVKNTAATGEQTADITTANINALPLELLRPLADRFAPGLQLTGTLSTNLTVQGLAAAGSAPVRADGTINFDNLSATGGPIGRDRFALARIEIPCRAAYHNRSLQIEQLGLACDVGQVTATGTFALPEKFDGNTIAALARSAFNVDGALDLAKLAALLPETLHVREGTQITSGNIRLAMTSKPEPTGHAFSAQLRASDITATDNGRQLAWQQPIDMELAARETPAGYAVDRLTCDSSFLNLSANGSQQQFTATARCDLDKLMAELSQFLDLRNVRLAGRGEANFNWQQADDHRFQIAAEAKFNELQIALPGQPVWQENSVVANAAASGVLAARGENAATNAAAASLVPTVRRLESAQLTANIENTAAGAREQLSLRLAQSVEQLSPNARWPIEAEVRGNVGRWWPRVAALAGIDGLDLAGAADIATTAVYSPQGVEIAKLKANLNDLHAWGFDTLFIDEPVVQLEAAGSYEFATGRLSLARTSLLTSSVSLQTEAARFDPGDATRPFSIEGNLSYQADLARLLRWITDPRAPAAYAAQGRLVGNANVNHTGSATTGNVAAEIDNFAVFVADAGTQRTRIAAPGNAQPVAEPVWTEPKLTLAASGGFDGAADAVKLASLEVGSQAFSLSAAGTLDEVSTAQNINLAGKVVYDWQTIGPLLKPYLGNGVRFGGKHNRKFAIRGPLAGLTTDTLTTDKRTTEIPTTFASSSSNKPPRGTANRGQADSLAFLQPLTAEVSFGWAWANVYGLPLGKLDLDAQLQDGTVSTAPIRTTIGREAPLGELNAQPIVRLTPGPLELKMGRTALVRQAPISQDLSNRWMKYLAPVLADSARVEGTFSLDVDGARVPLGTPEKSDIGGKLVLEKVTVAPGPLTKPLVLMAQQIEAIIKKRPPPAELAGNATLLKIADQQVPFRMVEGRIHHEKLTMQIGEVTLTTRGSVGIDESLHLLAEVPIKPQWRESNPLLKNWKQDSIQIPIEGTLSKPKLNAKIIEQLAPAFIEGATRGLIEGELNKALDRFLPLPPQR